MESSSARLGLLRPFAPTEVYKGKETTWRHFHFSFSNATYRDKAIAGPGSLDSAWSNVVTPKLVLAEPCPRISQEEEVEAERLAADQGNAGAQYALGRKYANGQGVPKDDAEAVKWYRKAADQGNSWAQYALGWMYDNGRGVPKDDAEAVKWYRKAADQGNAAAQNNLRLEVR